MSLMLISPDSQIGHAGDWLGLESSFTGQRRSLPIHSGNLQPLSHRHQQRRWAAHRDLVDPTGLRMSTREGIPMGIAKDLVDRQHDMLRRRDVTGVANLYSVDGYFSMAGMRISPTALPAVMQAYLAAFPDVDNEVTDWIETPDGIAVEQTITATHQGIWITPFGELAPTGRVVRWQAVEFVRIQDERIASWNSYFDQLAVLVALGAVPAEQVQ